MGSVFYEQSPPSSHIEYHLPIDIASVKHRALVCMNQVEGFCSESKASVLVHLILENKPQKIVEIGVWGGKSLLPMAYALSALDCGVIYGIDPWSRDESLVGMVSDANKSYWTWADHGAVLEGLIRKINEFNLGPWVELIRNTSAGADPIYDIDMLHIDGNHSDVTSFIDVTKWLPFVKKGGWVIFDDIGWYEEGIFTNARAVEWLNTYCEKVAEFKDDCRWGIWRKL